MLHIPGRFLIAMAVAAAQSAVGQSPAAAPSALQFEVASVKPGDPNAQLRGVRPAPGGQRYIATSAPLKMLIVVAYRLKAEQVIGGPDWINTAGFDMNAKAARPSSVEELHTMLQNLLAERFKLKFHRELKELPVYVLSVDKGGPKLTPHEAQNAGEPWMDQSVEQVTHVKLHATFAPMDFFAWRLGMMLDRPVVDQTELKGGYDFDLNFTRELPPGLPEGALLNGQPIDTSGARIFEAIRQQLGLKLEAKKAPVGVFVIDHAEKPAEN